MNKCSPMRTRTFAVALALVACALAARGEEEIVRARCRPYMAHRCEETYDREVFILDGRTIHFAYHGDGGICSLSCKYNQLNDVVWPRFPRVVNCSIMVLFSCAPIAGASYMDALRALNVTVTSELTLLDMPIDARVTSVSLRDAPPELEINVSNDTGLLELQQGALAKHPGMRRLVLNRVRAYELPTALKLLALINTSIEALIPNTLAVSKLKIEDYRLLTLSVPTAFMEVLSLTAPALESLWMYKGYMKVLQPRFAVNLNLHTLILESVEERHELREEFLFGASQLRVLKMIKCSLSTLPADLFSYSPKLKFVDLSRNLIKTLPVGLFTGLRELDTLMLTTNNLGAESLVALSPLVWLRELSLSGNPLGDLCDPEGRSPLSQLQQLNALYLSYTKLTHMCADWLGDMRALAKLDLRNNLLKTFPCDLRVKRLTSVGEARIDLYGNAINSTNCTRKDYRKAIFDPVDTQMVKLILQWPLKCGCERAWLQVVARERRVALVMPAGPVDCRNTVRRLGCENVLIV